MLDNRPIVVIANKITTNSQNTKTGDMVQTFILRDDIKPTLALKTGDDSSVCGQCRHRPTLGGSCYVNVGQSVQSVFGAFTRDRYETRPHDEIPELFRDRMCRIGTYGDPAAAPFEIWEHAFQFAKGVNGYTHQWRLFPKFKALCMASVDTPEEREEANAQGWRTFRVRGPSDMVLGREVVCPASKEAGFKTTCENCKACGGLSSKAKADIVIMAHGATAKRFSNDEPRLS